MSIDMTQFYQVFFEESAEHLAAMEGLLLDLDLDNPDSEQLNAIFRAAHSIKGSAATFGFTDLADTTHILESLLDHIRKHELELRADMVDVFLQSGDLLRSMLEAHQGRGVVDQAQVDKLLGRLRQLSAGEIEKPAVSVEVDAGHAGPDSGGLAPIVRKRIFDIQFVPTAVSAAGDGVTKLLDVLRTFGELEVLSKPEAGIHDIGYWQLRLQAELGAESFSDQIDFIAEAGAWRVVEDRGAVAGGAYRLIRMPRIVPHWTKRGVMACSRLETWVVLRSQTLARRMKRLATDSSSHYPSHRLEEAQPSPRNWRMVTVTVFLRR